MNSKKHLEATSNIREFVTTSSASTSGSTGGTISVTSPIPRPEVSPTHFDISRELHGFFGNLSSAFDKFAQIVNLVYFTNPLPDDQVTFYGTARRMRRFRQNEQLTRYICSVQNQQWYRDLKKFRKCEEHRKAILYNVLMEHGVMHLYSFPAVKAIQLPDNPNSIRPTYSLNREMKTFGSFIFINALGAIDSMYRLMEARIRFANHVPI